MASRSTGCALVADLEPGNFVEIDGLGHPSLERPRLHEFYQNAHANPRWARVQRSRLSS